VPFENLVGRAEVIFFSIEDDAHVWEFWKWPTAIRWDRLFDAVD
jgi:signal peptidase I